MEETWFIILISLCISVLLKSLLSITCTKKKSSTHGHKLPPGPLSLPIVGSLIFLLKSFSQLEPILRNLHAKFGPLVTLRIGSHLAIFVADPSLAHYALVQNGALFADRPPALPTNKLLTSNQQNISSSFYGSTWRLLRRNLTCEILHPSRVKSYSAARKWVLEILLHRLHSHSKSRHPISVLNHFQYAMFCLLVLMCFGDRLGEKQITEIQEVERRLLSNLDRFNILNFWPRLTKILFRKRWNELLQVIKDQEDMLIPLIRARKEAKQERARKGKEEKDGKEEFVTSYVDTLLDLELPEKKRKLNEEEMATLCSEFLSAGADTTSTALQWIMANMVKHEDIQERLLGEITGVVEAGAVEVGEEDLHKMPYLKAVILEGLRRHPPAHFVLPHSVREDVLLDGYVVPKNGSINFMVAEMGWNPKVWEDPMAFKPERFLSNISDENGGGGFDITGSREIKMMPFGAGRRICPAYGFAMLHLAYFVANLILNFNWKRVDGDDVDLSEKPEFTVGMKNPLHAHISPRPTLS